MARLTNEETQQQKKHRLGEEKYNKQGHLMKIVQYNKSTDIVVEFQDKYKHRIKSTYGSFANGSIKNPYAPSVLGIGIVGTKYTDYKRKTGTYFYEYQTWCTMLDRATNESFKNKHLTYIDCSVCNDWLLFENFCEWMHSQKNFNKHKEVKLFLDKDILQKGNKVYSPETCCLVPKSVNQVFTKANAIRGNTPIGVRKHEFVSGTRYSAYCTNADKYIYLGMFNTKEEAFSSYKKYKERLIKQIAEKEFSNGNIIEECYNAMINYKVEITD